MRYEPSYYAEYLGVINDQNQLEHYGIKGQKWYVRRFQNEDGSYTAAGKERYSRDSRKLGIGSLNDTKNTLKTLKRVSKECINPYSKNVDKKRLDEAVSLGLGAFSRITKQQYWQDGGRDKPLPFDPEWEERAKDYFVYAEDTIGYTHIADLFNKGYSGNKIKSLVNSARQLYREGVRTGDDAVNDLMFHFSGDDTDEIRNKFIKACEDEKRFRENFLNKYNISQSATSKDMYALYEAAVTKADDTAKDKNALDNGDHDRYNEVAVNAGKRAASLRLNEIADLKDSKDKDRKLNDYLLDAVNRKHDSNEFYAVVTRILEKSGDIKHLNFVTKEASSTAKDALFALKKETNLINKYYAKDQKTKYRADKMENKTAWDHIDQLYADHPDLKTAANKRIDSWNKYCEVVLKDIGMPVTDKNIDYIRNIIFDEDLME